MQMSPLRTLSSSSSAIIGPPNVTLYPNGATIEVSIKDPVFTISAFRKVYPSATYNIRYWKDGQKEKVRYRLQNSKCFQLFSLKCGVLLCGVNSGQILQVLQALFIFCSRNYHRRF